MTTTPRLGAPEWAASQAMPETTGNEIIRYVEQGAGFFIVLDKDLSAPPGGAADADAYIVGAAATGAWTGHEDEIAFKMNTAWEFITPIEGTHADVNDEDVTYRYSSGAWAISLASVVDETIDDRVAALMVAGTGISLSYNDGANTLTVTNTAPSGGAYTDENARDAIGAALVAGADINIAVNDGADTITIKSTAKRVVQIAVTEPAGSAIVVGDGQAYFRVPSTFNGMNLIEVAATLITASSSGIPTVQVANVTDAVDILSTKLTIDASETDSSTAATAAVIDTSKDDVATADLLRIDVDVAGTGAKGLMVTLTFQLP